ncbi:LacI family DNA-binding transcriptional regulator [Lysobacter korlensis]|uniref:LacI family DNA-binding transcriptional regulator n=1 Tax=Lysobacter korlensis TaxID=553636 RepID=A0ABV6S0X7_9GAMM
MRQLPNMHDVAEVAGVSHQTVSRVLNDQPHVRHETRERVLRAIAELGYRPNAAAKTLVTRRSRTIGVLTPAVAQHGPTRSVLAIESAARQYGYRPLVTATAVDRGATLGALRFLLDQGIEGLVVIAPHEHILNAISDLDPGLPVVVLQATGRDVGTGVGVDQRKGGRLAVSHLLELGHTRIQHVAGPAEYFEARARAGAYLETLMAAGAPALPVIQGDWTAESGYRAAALLDPDTTGVFCANDESAIGLIRGLAERGVRVPDDVSIVGFDDLPEAAYLLPSLTTVSQDLERVGREAVLTLTSRLDGTDHETAPVEPMLKVRESTRRH